MGVVAQFLEHAAENLTDASRKELSEKGSLDPNQVRLILHTQEDDKVRPSHEALDGLVGHPGDPNFPVPPYGPGCRCFVEYCAVEGTPAASFLKPTSEPVRSVALHYAEYLSEKLPDWRKIQAAIDKLPKKEATSKAALLVEKALPDLDMADVRQYVTMIMQA